MLPIDLQSLVWFVNGTLLLACYLVGMVLSFGRWSHRRSARLAAAAFLLTGIVQAISLMRGIAIHFFSETWFAMTTSGFGDQRVELMLTVAQGLMAIAAVVLLIFAFRRSWRETAEAENAVAGVGSADQVLRSTHPE